MNSNWIELFFLRNIDKNTAPYTLRYFRFLFIKFFSCSNLLQIMNSDILTFLLLYMIFKMYRKRSRVFISMKCAMNWNDSSIIFLRSLILYHERSTGCLKNFQKKSVLKSILKNAYNTQILTQTAYTLFWVWIRLIGFIDFQSD